MPKSKLQQALIGQQHEAAWNAAKKKSTQNKQAKEDSLKHSAKEKKVMKKVRQRREKALLPETLSQEEGKADGNGNGDMVVIDDSNRPSISIDIDMEDSNAKPIISKKKAKKIKQGVNPNQLPVVPFTSTDTILLLGEANFSYSLSILTSHSHPAHQMLATSYDTERECYLKYPDGEGNVTKLREAGVKVEFKVDAGNLEKCKAVGKGRWSRVIFNFPHAGAGITDQDRNILTNQHLLLRTLRSVAPVLTIGSSTNGNGSENDNKRKSGSNLKRPNSKYASKRLRTQVVKEKDSENPELDLESDVELDSDEEGGGGGFNLEELVGISTNEEKVFTPPHRQGSILITLLNQPPYTLWSLPQLAQRPPPCCPGTRLPQPRFRLERSFKFHPELYEGYAHRRTIGFKEGKSKADNEEIIGRAGEARTWEFVKAVERAERE